MDADKTLKRGLSLKPDEPKRKPAKDFMVEMLKKGFILENGKWRKLK